MEVGGRKGREPSGESSTAPDPDVATVLDIRRRIGALTDEEKAARLAEATDATAGEIEPTDETEPTGELDPGGVGAGTDETAASINEVPALPVDVIPLPPGEAVEPVPQTVPMLQIGPGEALPTEAYEAEPGPDEGRPKEPSSGDWHPPADGAVDECPFLAGAGPVMEAEGRDCLAFGEPLTLSQRQRELVCLRSIHSSCPRYLHATALESRRDGPSRLRRIARPMTIAIVCILVVSAAVLALGPRLPFAGFGAVSSTPPVTAVASASPSIVPVATPFRTAATAAPSQTPRVTSAPTPAHPTTTKPAPSAQKSPSWPPGATQSRMAMLTPCPSTTGCYLYTVRFGDALSGIVYFFGVPEQTVLAWNPQIVDPDQIKEGQVIRIPSPTR